MKDDSQFEASTKSGIHADPVWIRKNDEILREFSGSTRKFLLAGLLLLAAAAGTLGLSVYQTGLSISLGKLIIPVILLLISIFCLYMYIVRKKSMAADLEELYEEGLLTGALIISTEPFMLMALANLTAYDGVPNRYGCYKLAVKKLKGAKGQLYEKIPCSSFFRYESGNYHDAFQPRPLYWGTSDLSSIAQALITLEAENTEEDEDTWEVIRRIAERFPDLKDGQIVILDENYEPIGIRYYWQTGLEPVPGKEQTNGEGAGNSGGEALKDGEGTDQNGSNRQGGKDGKQPQQAELNMRDKPGREVYERFLKLACSHKVYNYINGHCKNGSMGDCTHPGFFNPVGDPVTFPQELRERKFTLMSEEYPLFMGKYLVTTRGFYRKNQFIPWREAEITVKADFLDTVKVYVNGKYCTEFASSTEGYEGREEMTEDDKSKIARLEAKRVEEFLLDIKENGV